MGLRNEIDLARQPPPGILSMGHEARGAGWRCIRWGLCHHHRCASPDGEQHQQQSEPTGGTERHDELIGKESARRLCEDTA